MTRLCTKDDLTKAAELAFSLNSIPEHNSAYCCLKYDSIYSDFLHAIEHEPHFLLGEFEEGVLLGVAGFFVDENKGTADCCGPFVQPGENYLDVAKPLISHAQALLDNNTRIGFFFDKRNAELLELMKHIKAEDRGNECILQLNRNDYIPCAPKHDVVPLEKEYEREFVELHDFIWPDAYISGSEVLRSDERHVYMVLDNGAFAAYCVLHLPSKSEGSVAEMLATKTEYRCKGMGQAMLNKLVSDSFKLHNREYVDLVVENSNQRAMRLYLQFGFKLLTENYSFQM